MQEPILCGKVSTYCVAIQHEGLQPHELLCVQPQLLCAAEPNFVDWDAVSEALRSFLLQLHHVNQKLPPADEGDFCIKADAAVLALQLSQNSNGFACTISRTDQATMC